jgi:hypothetical protein
MADSNGPQFDLAPHRAFSRRKAALLVGLALVIAAGSAALFSPILPEITAAFNTHPTSSATTADDASMFRFNAEHTRFNAHENILTFATVSHLAADWASPATGGSIFSSPVAANGVIYVGSFDSKLYAFAAAGCGQSSCPPLWTAPTEDRIFSTPAVSAGVVYVGSYDSRLYAFNAAGCGQPSCPPLWTSTPTGGRIGSSPLVAGGMVYVGSWDHKLYAFNAAGCGQPSCPPLWTSTPAGNLLLSSPAAQEESSTSARTMPSRA